MRIKRKVLDLGGGTNPYLAKNDEEVIVMDFYATNKNYIKHDAENIPYPFKNEFFDKIYASHILEHLSNLWIEKDKKCVFDELWRILKKKGILIVRVPHPSVCYNWAHPTHKRTCSINSFNFLEKDCEEKYTKNNFKILKKELRYNRLGFFGKIITKFANKSEKTQYIFERYLCYYFGGFDEVYFELIKN
jgi:SAM-dependent methyltransferase